MLKYALTRQEKEAQTISSLEVAEMIGKPHDQLMRSIRNYIEVIENDPSAKLQTAEFFIESTYIDKQNQERPCYLLTKKGCDMVANKITGAKGIIFTAKYVDRFDKMEQVLKEQNQPQSMSMEDIIIYQMQQSKLMKEQLEQTQTVAIEAKATAEQATKQMEAVRDAMLLDHDSWRKECTTLINKIAQARGGDYSSAHREAYQITEQRGRANLKQRITNKQDRLRRDGATKTTVDKVKPIDVIAEDARLKQIYIGVVKDMAIKYGVA